MPARRLRILSLCLVLSLLFALLPAAASASGRLRVFLDGVELVFADQQPQIIGGRTLVPVRYLSESLGAAVEWQQDLGRVTVDLDGVSIVLHVGDPVVTANGRPITLDIPATIVGGRTMVPLRFVSEVLGAGVYWSQEQLAVFVSRSERSTVWQTSYYPANYVRLEAPGGHLLSVQGMATRDLPWVWVMVRDGARDKVAETIVELGPLGELSATLDLSGLAPGTYGLDLFFGRERYGTYNSRHLGLPLAVYGSGIDMPKGPMYQHNLAEYEGRVRDPLVLARLDLPEIEAQVITAQATAIIDGIDGDYARLLAIHDWVAANIHYDWDNLLTTTARNNRAYNTLLARRAVCQGYAELTVALLRSVGIPARLVIGHALGATNPAQSWQEADHGNANHAWNEAYVDGRWIIFDVTWNSSNRYVGGEYVSGPIMHTFFDMTIEALSVNHKIIR